MRKPATHHETPAAAARDRFVEAALDLFVEHGFNGTSLQMIGDQLGVTKAAVYYHFRSKDELLSAIVTPALDALDQVLADAELVAREAARRKKALHDYVDYLIAHRRVVTWLAQDIAAVSNPVVWEPAQKFSGRIDTLLTSAVSDPRTRLWGGAITQALTGALLNETTLSDDELRVELELLGEHLIRGYQAAHKRHARDAGEPASTRS